MKDRRQFKVVIEQKVFDDILVLYSYVCQDSISEAAHVRDALLAAIRSLADFPERYPYFVGETVSAGRFRKMVVLGRFLVFYRVCGEEVYIIRVIDGKQDYKWLL